MLPIRKLKLCTAALLFTGTLLSGAFAQSLKLAGINYLYFPKTDVQQGSGKKGEIDYQEMGAFVTVPLLSKNKQNIFLNTVRFELIRPVLHHPANSTEDKLRADFYGITYSLAWVHSFQKHWNLILGLTPTLASDLQNKLSSRDFLLQGTALLQYRFSEKYLAGAGMAYSTGFGRPLLLPLFQFNYLSGPFSALLIIPASADIFFTFPGKRVKLGLRGKVMGNDYNINSEYIPSGTTTAIDNVRYSRINLGPALEWIFYKGLTAELSAGFTSNRILEYEDRNGQLIKYDAHAGPFFGIGLSFQPPTAHASSITPIN